MKCLFEAQKYPDRRIYPGGPAEPPYDVAGWTLPMQMGVDYAEAGKRFDAKLEKIEAATPPVNVLRISPEVIRARGVTFYIPTDANNAFAIVNEFARSKNGLTITRLKQPATVVYKNFSAGSFMIQTRFAKGKLNFRRSEDHSSRFGRFRLLVYKVRR